MRSMQLDIRPELLVWAIQRAGLTVEELTRKGSNVASWIEEKNRPTVKQLEKFSQQVYVPFGYLFLPEPPEEDWQPIPFFRTDGNNGNKINLNVYDTVLLLQQRQEWLRGYLKDNDFDDLDFVGRYNNSSDVVAIVNDICQTLGLQEDWASHFKTWEETLDHLVEKIEDRGIITVFNGVVGNNPYRKIPVEECRGFVLVDKTAPFMFINNSDSKAAQMFTIVHELAHIWTGKSAGFDFRKLQPAEDANEKICDRVAAEFLVPESEFARIWKDGCSYKEVGKYFKVSEIVIARRALDTGKIKRDEFFAFYDEYIRREVKTQGKQTGGNFYATTRKRLSFAFASHVYNAFRSGDLLYRDACKLTGLKGDTFQTFCSKNFQGA